MSWKESMGPASFRGVPFHVKTSEQSGGRRGPLHEFPGRDTPYRQDMGRKARSYPVEGYVIGDDYFSARDALIAALEESGTGELLHPYYGTLRVAVESFTVRESTDRGGMAEFAISFVESAARPLQPTEVADPVALVDASVTAMEEATVAEFLAQYNAGPRLESVSAALLSATVAINSVLEFTAMNVQSLALLRKQLDTFVGSLAEAVDEPNDIVAALTEIFDLMDTAAALLSLYEFDPGTRPPATTANRAQEQANFDAILRLIQRLALVRAVELAVDQEWESYDQAINMRDRLTALLDDQAESAADDTYPAVMQLRADLVKAIPGEAGDLPRLVSYTPPATVPSLVLAHRLYGNLDREADLLARNRVRNPAAVPGGEALEVLSRD